MDGVKKEYILRIVWSKDQDELEHLSESYSGVERIRFEVDGRLVEPPEHMQKILRKHDTDTLGIC